MANELVQANNGEEGKSEYQLATIDPAELQEVFRENVGGDGVNAFDLGRVKIPAGGALTWSVPTLEGEEATKTLRGIIVHQREVRSYWSTSFADSGGGVPPDCSSQDGITGHGNPGGACASCPLNQWGSAGDGKKGKACRQVKLIFLVRETEFMPLMLALAPTSIPAAKKYFLALSSRALPYHGVVTEFTLEKALSDGGIPYGRAVPRMVRKLSAQEHAVVAANAKTIKSALQAIKIDDPEDYGVDTAGSDG